VTATRRLSAFTLSELGAVLAATGIVAALAYSVYRTYTVRSEVSEGIALANDLIPAVTEFFRRHGEVPANLEAPVPHSGTDREGSPFVESITVVDGRIDVLYGGQADPAIAGRRISLTPYETVDRNVVWLCGNEIPGPGLEPLGFAGGSRRTVQVPTTIEGRYLPGPCR
jgi:type IV pilus assembly protein PilA